MHKPLVSIVLPVYNGSRFLRDSIDSCLAQTYPSWELVIVDDCSTDATSTVLEDCRRKDARIRIVRHDVNRGLPAALNTGFRVAVGEYLAWTSDDNLYRPRALSAMTAFLDTHPDIGLVYADYSYIDEAGKVTGTKTAPPVDTIWDSNPVGPCFLYRRDVRNRIGDYTEALFTAEDYDYWLRITAQYKVGVIHENLYMYRLHGGSLTSQRQEKIQLAVLEAVRRNLKNQSWMSRRSRAQGYIHHGWRAWYLGKKRLSRQLLSAAFWLNPREVFRRGDGRWLIGKLVRP